VAHLTADYYVSVEHGNDANSGTSEAEAWATIDKAASTVQAGTSGPTVIAIAPGTYRETIVADYAGTAGNEIKFVGDPECLYFDNEKPGRVRITDTNAAEEDQGSAILITSYKDYVEWHNLHLDSSRVAIHFQVAWSRNRVIYDSVIWGKVDHGGAVRCIIAHSQNPTWQVLAYNCIAICGENSAWTRSQTYNCLGIGGTYVFDFGGDANALAHNCIALAGTQGFRYSGAAGAINSCYAFHCRYAGRDIGAGHAVNSYYAYCIGGVYDADYGSEGIVELLDLGMLTDLLPWVALNTAGGLLRQGDNTGPGFDPTDVDIGGHRLRLKGSDLDIGPWSVSEPPDHPYSSGGSGLLDWGTYHTTPPSIKITAEGDYTINIPAEAGTAITVTVQSKHKNIGAEDKPQLILAGDSITNQADTNTAADDVWDELTVSATPDVDEVLTVIFRARNNTGNCYFSDLKVS